MKETVEARAERILVVDDEDAVRSLMVRLLTGRGHPCATAANAAEARTLLAAEPYALVLTDVHMPGESGVELADDILRDYPETAVVMVTGLDDRSLAETALDHGAYGYVLKPFRANEVLINVANALRRRALELENRHQREHLEREVSQRTAALRETITRLESSESELRRLREETIRRLSVAAEFRSHETGLHIVRMSLYCALLARLAGLPANHVELIRIASPMHDVGKIAVPDSVLLKPGRLTVEERLIMQTHAEMGHSILSGSGTELLDVAATMALTHHERVDGTGYPRGLRGDAIPPEGRIAAVADVFDALTSDRVYRAAFQLEEAVEIMRAGRGTHFDAPLLDLFLGALDDVMAIRGAAADMPVRSSLIA